jgi:Protein of unknown function (DUF3667)
MSIHKKRRKVEICHNCHTILSLENNFCPHCGQENHDLKVPISHLAFEVFEGFTHFDTKFYNTMRAIFLSPGKITKDFLEGRRGRYVPPVRLYFLISFVFFLGLGNWVDLSLEDGTNFLSKEKLEGEFFGGAVTVNSPNKAKKELEKELVIAQKKVKDIKSKSDTTGLFKAEEKVKQVNSSLKLLDKVKRKSDNFLNVTTVSIDEILDEMNIQQSDTLRKLIYSLSEEKQRLRLIDIQKQIIADTVNTEEFVEITPEMRTYFTETIGKKRQLQYSLNLYALKNNASIKINYDEDTIITIKGSNGSLHNKAFLKKVQKMSNAELDSLLDKDESLNILGIRFLERGFAKNVAYYQLAFSEDGQKASIEIAQLFVAVFSLMMFILMPIVALLLKLIYSKRTHSIFSYPFRLIRYLWDWILYLVRFRKVRKYKHIPHVFFGHTRYYYEHLIFSIHIHAVFFLMLMIFVGGGILLGYGRQAAFITLIGFFVYFIVSLKTVYRQGILKTLFKSVILFFLYFISFVTVLSLTSAIKFALS